VDAEKLTMGDAGAAGVVTEQNFTKNMQWIKAMQELQQK
jgi:hypothetical protein